MGEQCDVGIESTVLDMTGDVPTILRPGIVTREWLMSVLGREVAYHPSLFEKPDRELDPNDIIGEQEGASRPVSEKGIDADEGFRPRSPGMKYKHYSPNAKVRLIEGDSDEFRSIATALGLEAVREGHRPAVVNYGDDVRKAAHDLFADLRELDRQGYDLILIRTLERSGLGFSVMNRMLKSAGYDIVE